MRPKIIFALVALFALTSLLLHRPPTSLASTPAKQPVIVELFTSEGCSSCPPADTLLKQLSDDQPFDNIEIIALEEHVDYWNHLGWSDPFSSPDFTSRQNDYATRIPNSGVYTPQIVVDGRAQLVGSRADELREQLRAAAAHPKPRLLLSSVPAKNTHTRAFELRLDPNTEPLPQTSLDFYVAVTEKGLRANPTSGENSGASLVHSPVVRELRKLPSVRAPLTDPVSFTVDLHNNWNPSNLTAVAFLVDPHSHQIQAAISATIQ